LPAAGHPAEAATDQPAQQVRVDTVVAAGAPLIGAQFLLDLGELLGRDNGVLDARSGAVLRTVADALVFFALPLRAREGRAGSARGRSDR
jgi:hypothetical protein